MPTRPHLLTAALLAALLLLALAGCNAARPTLTPPAATPALTPAPTPLAAATPTPAPTIAPCSPPVACDERDVSGTDLVGTQIGGAASGRSKPESTVEEILENGLLPDVFAASPTHIAFRGVASLNSVRCDWQGSALTMQAREGAIRFWLGIDAEDPIPAPDEVVRQSMTLYADQAAPAFREETLAIANALAYGGLNTEQLRMACYADYSVNEYLLASGPAMLSVAYQTLRTIMSYDLYARAYAAGQFINAPLRSRGEYQAYRDSRLREMEDQLSSVIEGRESIVFLAPMGVYQPVTVQAWMAVAQWDVQLVDGVLQAVRYGTWEYDDEYSQTLDNLKSRITTAAATDKFAGQRIASAEGLEAYYREIGAYDDITPGDGLDNPFTPAHPPPPYSTPSPP